MRTISLDELKDLQVDILSKVHDFCIKNNIRYTLAYGTLIGAVRHKGYIPWDDDIDIAMPRPDYDRFLNTFNGSVDFLQVISPEITTKYYAPFAIVHDTRTVMYESLIKHQTDLGIKIDIFPIDGVIDEQDSYRRRKKICHYRRLLYAKNFSIKSDKSIPYKMKMLLRKVVDSYMSLSTVQKRIMKIASCVEYSTAPYADCLAFQYADIIMPRTAYESYIDMEFEGHLFKGLSQYNLYLTKCYGDYMQLPPEDQRVPHHGFTAYWKD